MILLRSDYPPGISLLEAAIRAKNIDLVDTLLQCTAGDGDEGAMRAAVYHGMDVIEKVLAAHEIFSPYRNSLYLLPALHLAIRRRDYAIIQRLLQSNARVDVMFDDEGETVDRHRKNLFGEERRAYHDSCISTALEAATDTDRETDLPIFRQILSCITDVNAAIRSADGRWATPLILAIRHRNRGAMDLLLQLGALVDTPTTHLLIETPLQTAVKTGDKILVQKLLNLGVSVNAPPKKSEGIAAREGFVPIIKTLLSAGADVNAPGSGKGGTALEQAAKLGRVDMIHLLVQYGSLLIGPGVAQFKRAKELATESGHHAACRLLESLRDEQFSTFNFDQRDIMRIPPRRFLASEDQDYQAENSDATQHGDLSDLESGRFPQDFMFGTETFVGQINTTEDVNAFTDFTLF